MRILSCPSSFFVGAAAKAKPSDLSCLLGGMEKEEGRAGLGSGAN